MKGKFESTIFNFGLVLKSNIDQIQQVKEFIAFQEDIEVVYQTLDRCKLWIMRGDNNGR